MSTTCSAASMTNARQPASVLPQAVLPARSAGSGRSNRTMPLFAEVFPRQLQAVLAGRGAIPRAARVLRPAQGSRKRLPEQFPSISRPRRGTQGIAVAAAPARTLLVETSCPAGSGGFRAAELPGIGRTGLAWSW